MQLPARGFAALALLYDLICSYLRCRSASLVEVQPNHRLTEHSSMRRAQQCRIRQAVCRPMRRHTRLTVVRRGCELSRIAGIHGEAMYTAPDSASTSALQAPSSQWRGQGAEPLAFSWGCKGAILSRERMAPFIRAVPSALLFPIHAQREKPPLICKDKKTTPRCCEFLRSAIRQR